MLLVDDDQAELRERHALLHQRVRADDHRRAASSAAQRLAVAPCPAPCRRAKRPRCRAASASAEVAQMLLGQQFGRRHQRRPASRLPPPPAPRAPRRRSCRCRHRPAPDAASAWRCARSLATSSLTRCCAFVRLERQTPRASSSRKLPVPRSAGRMRFVAQPRACACRLRCWVSSSSKARRCCAGCGRSELPQVGVRRRPVHIKQRVAQRGQPMGFAQSRGGINSSRASGGSSASALRDHTGKPRLPQAFGRGIDRR